MAQEQLKVNFSDEEAASEGRSFEPIPGGSYFARCTDWEMKECGPESKNPGKPYWHLEFVIQDGPFEDRKLWGNVMLFEGALYSLAQLMKAVGNWPLKGGVVPDGSTLIGEPMILVVKKMRDKYKEEKDGDGETYFKNEIGGYKKYEGAGSTTPSGKSSNSLLP